MLGRSRNMTIVWAVAAGCFLAAAGMLQPALDDQSKEYELNPPEVTENYPLKSLLTMAPGGLRAPIVSYLWTRAENLKNDGRYYEARQLAELICDLQPNFAGVWAFHAWNMAYNISVQTHTPEERWRWVYGGVELLRDRGIPQNRKALILYKELGWIFYHKMGRYMDDMHLSYKQRWASKMQRLLAAPPYGTTAETIAAFRPIAEAPIDKDFRRQGRSDIQRDQLETLLADAEVAAYAELLRAQQIEVDQGLLDAYNRFSLNEEVQTVRVEYPQLKTDRDKAISELINSASHSPARGKLLAFVRAQVLWNVYKLDPDWMLQLMEKFGPLDWRVIMTQALYWMTYGLHICEAKELGDIDSLNTDRGVLNAMKVLTWTGKLTYLENPRNVDLPAISWSADRRFIDPTQAEYMVMAEAVAKARGDTFRNNQLATGHVNYLSQAIEMLYAAYSRRKAQTLLDWIVRTYRPDGPEWSMDLEDFVIFRLNLGGQPSQDVVYSQVTAALQAAFLQRAVGRSEGYRQSVVYAKRVYDAYAIDAPQRIHLPPFAVIASDNLISILIRPGLVGVKMSLVERSQLYKSLNDQMQRRAYDRIAPALSQQCEIEGLDVDKAFPAPPGVEPFRRGQQPER